MAERKIKSSQKSSQKSSDVIISIMSENKSVTIAELATACNISTRAVQKNIDKLRNAGVVKRIGPDKGGYWKVNKLS